MKLNQIEKDFLDNFPYTAKMEYGKIVWTSSKNKRSYSTKTIKRLIEKRWVEIKDYKIFKTKKCFDEIKK